MIEVSQAVLAHRYWRMDDADPLPRPVDMAGAAIAAAMQRNKGGEVVPIKKSGGAE
ncbi:hypothetical protein QM467_01565 [Rhodoblastus sp. 17X3]|uniref:hypothetical protein n=1 Tax=Rhodoblastus sp. 17X3 TaxID=3047026 RepID=UPI0024B67FE8|nr:hypothetical protein [Rhodoblastus sp. 17X3]MDI9846742.1 hypothetical protein [Rhodoblastus sp. 17X3]